MFYRLRTCLLLKDQCVRNGHLDVVVPCSDESVNHISINYVTSFFPKTGEEEEEQEEEESISSTRLTILQDTVSMPHSQPSPNLVSLNR